MLQSSINKKGILLVNLGTPRSDRPKDVFLYLSEFLTDGRVIDIPWIKRQLLVRGIIVPFRFRQSAQQYRQLWTERGSPLFFHGIDVRDKLKDKLGDSFEVVLAMRYASSSIREGLEQLKQAQVDEILIFPLFPQYASATTGSVHQEVMKTLSKWLVIPKLTFINSYFDHPALIEAFCARAREYPLTNYDHFIFSFHGLPERHIRKADDKRFCLKTNCCQNICQDNQFCYKAQCYATARAIAKKLNLNQENTTVCFQSRLGKDPWISPYTCDVIHQRAKKNDKRLLIFSPAFICDCLETIYEISYEYKKEFLDLGGEEFQLVTGLNDHPKWIEALKIIILENLTSLNPS